MSKWLTMHVDSKNYYLVQRIANAYHNMHAETKCPSWLATSYKLASKSVPFHRLSGFNHQIITWLYSSPLKRLVASPDYQNISGSKNLCQPRLILDFVVVVVVVVVVFHFHSIYRCLLPLTVLGHIKPL